MTKISVIISTWNRVSTIKRAIKSVLDQTYPVYEILICDDGSTDRTKEVVNSISDNRIKWIEGEHSGKPAVPRNKGIKLAKGEWIAFLDSDDYWYSEKIEKQLRIASDKKKLAICCNADRINNEQKFLGKLIDLDKSILTFNDLLKCNYVVCSSALIHQSLIKECKGFPEEKKLIAIEDYAFWLRITTFTDFAYLMEPLLAYRDESKESIRKYDSNILKQRIIVLRSYISWWNNTKGINKKYKTLVRKFLWDAYLNYLKEMKFRFKKALLGLKNN